MIFYIGFFFPLHSRHVARKKKSTRLYNEFVSLAMQMFVSEFLMYVRVRYYLNLVCSLMQSEERKDGKVKGCTWHVWTVS